MTLNQIFRAEQIAVRATNTVSRWVETGPERDALTRAEQIIGEARFYAAGIDEIRKDEDNKKLDPLTAQIKRKEYADRLLAFLTPDRF